MNIEKMKNGFNNAVMYTGLVATILFLGQKNSERMHDIYHPDQEKTKTEIEKQKREETSLNALKDKAEKDSYRYRGFILD